MRYFGAIDFWGFVGLLPWVIWGRGLTKVGGPFNLFGVARVGCRVNNFEYRRGHTYQNFVTHWVGAIYEVYRGGYFIAFWGAF